jgi:glycine/D-amino acid oxidase-like deaminating enzyme
LTAARALARAGASVVVLERERAGWGASSRNGGQVLAGLKLDPGTLVRRYGEQRAQLLFDASLQSIARLEALIASESIDCEYEQTGHIQAASKPAHFAAFKEEQALLARVFAHRVELVPAAEQRREVGSSAYHGLIVDERSGAINPARYVEGLATAVIRAGALVVTGASVTHVARQGTRWTVAVNLENPANPGNPANFDVSDVLFATNGYADRAAPALQRRFIPIGSYVIATEPLGEAVAGALLPRRRMAFDSRHFLHYFRLTSDRRLLFGGRAEFSQPAPDTTRHAAKILRSGMVSVFPELANTRIDFAWGGRVAFTRDQMPHAGRLDDGAYYAGGYCGHGIAMATYLGDLIGRRIAGELMEHPLMDDRFPAIPLYGGTPWFLPLAGLYYRFLDWWA